MRYLTDEQALKCHCNTPISTWATSQEAQRECARLNALEAAARLKDARAEALTRGPLLRHVNPVSAAHEAAHVCVLLAAGGSVKSATALGGLVAPRLPQDRVSRAAVALAGLAATDRQRIKTLLATHDCYMGAGGELARLLGPADYEVLAGALPPSDPNSSWRAEEALELAFGLLAAHGAAHGRLADALQRHALLTGDQCRELFHG